MSRNIDWTELEIIKPNIACGRYGDVYKINWKNEDGQIETIVAKEFRNFVSDDDINREIQFLSRVNHENIISIFGITKTDGNKPVLLMEYATCGSLHKIVHKKTKDILDIPYLTKHNWMLQLSNGLNYLHQLSPKIIHRDLKPDNILITDAYRILKICDFGTVKELSTVNTADIGTPVYMAPEVSTSDSYTEKCDVYSYGIILWEVLSGKLPYYHLNNNLALYIKMKTVEGDRPPLADVSNLRNSNILTQLIESCWDKDPDKRPIMEHISRDLLQLQKASENDSILSCSEESEAYVPMNPSSHRKYRMHSSACSLSESSDDRFSVKSIRYSSKPCKYFSNIHPHAGVPLLMSRTFLKSSLIVNWKEISLIKNIGYGAFGDIYKAEWKQPNFNQIVAIKVMREMDNSVEGFEDAIYINYKLQHENIISLYGISRDENEQKATLMEYADCGSLYSLLHEEDSEFGSEFSEHSAKIWMLQCAKGLAYLHKENIIHRDLKTRILLLTNNLKTLKIGGLNSITKFNSNLTKMVGTGIYMAPEIATGDSNYTEMCDVYSFGIILWEVFSRKIPFYHLQPIPSLILMKEIAKGMSPNLKDIRCSNYDKMCGLILKCWAKVPQSRPTIEHVMDKFLNWA